MIACTLSTTMYAKQETSSSKKPCRMLTEGESKAESKIIFMTEVAARAVELAPGKWPYAVLAQTIGHDQAFLRTGIADELTPQPAGDVPGVNATSGEFRRHQALSRDEEAVQDAGKLLREVIRSSNNTGMDIWTPNQLLTATLAELYNIALAYYGTTSIKDLQTSTNKANAPWNVSTETVDAVAQRHKKNHELHASADNPISQSVKVNQFFAILVAARPSLDFYVSTFLSSKKPAKQTFAKATEAMQQACKILDDREAVCTAVGGAAAMLPAANAAVVSDAKDAMIASLQAQVQTLLRTANRNGGGGGGGGKAGGFRKRYCFIHGRCGHDGADCEQGKSDPPPGFKTGPDITWENRDKHKGSSVDRGAFRRKSGENHA